MEAEESEAHRTHHETGAIRDALFFTVEEPTPLNYEVSSEVNTSIEPQLSSIPDPEELTGCRESPTSATHPDSISSTLQHGVPMPVTANADVVDPTSCPGTPSRANLISAVLDVEPQAQQQALGDGLFTPADESTTVTPASINSHVLDELARVFFGIPIVSSTPMEEFSSVLSAEHMSNLGLVIDDQAIEEIEAPVQLPPIGAEVMHISGAHPSEIIQARDGPMSPLPPDPPISMPATLTRKPTDPILVSDPYPYSLSTPGVYPTEEESEQDNSLSSNSTFEKDLEDKDTYSIHDDANDLELQYPESDILTELNSPAAAEGEEASKFVDEVADVAHGDFYPESVVARLAQLSAEVQQANLPTIDSTVAPGPISDILAELNSPATAKDEEASKTVDEVADVAHGGFGQEFVVARSPQLSAEVQAANLPAIDSTVAPGPISDVLGELNGPATAKGEEASKIVDEVADVARGDFIPESVVARIPQLSAKVQPENLPTIDSTVAPGPISDILAELNGPATAKGQEASKIDNEVADVFDGEFGSESEVARLPQLSAEVQPANLPTVDNTVAPGPLFDVLAVLNGPAMVKGEEASKNVDDEVADVAHGDFGPESVVALLPRLSAEVQPEKLPTVDSTVAPGPISDILTELNGPTTAKGEEASKIDEVADVTHGDFGPKSVVARLPQLSTEVQPANVSTIDNTVAPGPINSVEKDDTRGEIFPT